MRDFDWQIIVQLHRAGSITKAAEGLFITQPALTRRIRAIESELGLPLLVRTRKGSVFTAEGERIAQHAERIMAAIRAVHDERERLIGSLRPVLTVGAPHSFSRFVLPSLLRTFSETSPGADIQLLTLPSQDLIGCVESGRADLCFSRYLAEDTPLLRRSFSVSKLHAVYSRPFSVEDTARLPFIHYPMNPGTAAELEHWRKEQGLPKPHPVLRVGSEDLCLALIRQGLGYGILPDDGVGVDEPDLFSLPLQRADGSPLYRTTWIYSRAPGDLLPLAEVFIRCAEAFAAVDKKGAAPN